ncbi:MAG: hypothetical protein CVU54_01475 [Deltaproteobacteria bacterium HGW-Deltaproteobacteria-12]|jgi:hypothetical protein|nr:MAG: hypothetical protein CVU54_01475 [Deltaproteobacteria bacterium HGW-Deltaproteobacteria-12]
MLREKADERGVYNAIGFLCQLIFLTLEIFLSDFFLQGNRSGIQDERFINFAIARQSIMPQFLPARPYYFGYCSN